MLQVPPHFHHAPNFKQLSTIPSQFYTCFSNHGYNFSPVHLKHSHDIFLSIAYLKDNFSLFDILICVSSGTDSCWFPGCMQSLAWKLSQVGSQNPLWEGHIPFLVIHIFNQIWVILNENSHMGTWDHDESCLLCSEIINRIKDSSLQPS